MDRNDGKNNQKTLSCGLSISSDGDFLFWGGGVNIKILITSKLNITYCNINQWIGVNEVINT